MRNHGWLGWVLALGLVASPALGGHHLPGEGGESGDLGTTGGDQNETMDPTPAPSSDGGGQEGVTVDGPEDGMPEDSSGEAEDTGTTADPTGNGSDSGSSGTTSSDPDPASPSSEAAAPVQPVRPVFDASNWAAVTGPLNSLYQAWKAEQAAAGIIWDDEGHITNIEGATITSSYRADSVPQEAIDWMVSHADQLDGVLVASSAGAAAAMGSEEVARVARGDGDNSLPSGEPGGGDTLGTGDSPVGPDEAASGDGTEEGEGSAENGADGTEDVPDLSETEEQQEQPASDSADRPGDSGSESASDSAGAEGSTTDGTDESGNEGTPEIPEGTEIPEGAEIPEGTEIPEGIDLPEGLDGIDPELAGQLLSGS